VGGTDIVKSVESSCVHTEETFKKHCKTPQRTTKGGILKENKVVHGHVHA
jgi:hypothetical protein